MLEYVLVACKVLITVLIIYLAHRQLLHVIDPSPKLAIPESKMSTCSKPANPSMEARTKILSILQALSKSRETVIGDEEEGDTERDSEEDDEEIYEEDDEKQYQEDDEEIYEEQLRDE